jgi:transposase
MKPYSQDLRERIVRGLEAHEESQVEIAERFAVSLSCVEKLWRRWRTTGKCAALPHAGGRQRRLGAIEAVLRAAVRRDPDITLEALCEPVGQAGGPQVSTKTMCVELQRLNLPLKRSRFTLASVTPPA